MINKIIDIDKSIMILLNKDISNPVFDLIMPIITSKDFLTIIGVILIFYLLGGVVVTEVVFNYPVLRQKELVILFL